MCVLVINVCTLVYSISHLPARLKAPKLFKNKNRFRVQKVIWPSASLIFEDYLYQCHQLAILDYSVLVVELV